MFNRKLGVLIATAAITFTPIAVPQAFAQTAQTQTGTTVDGYSTTFDMSAAIPMDAQGVLRDGTTTATAPLPNGAAETMVAGLPKYKIYTYEGEDFVMELRQSNKDSKGNVVLNPQGIPVWGYYILSKNGDKSDSCRIDMLTKSVNDPSLYDYTRNGFLYTLGGVENTNNPESQYIHTAIQHWGGSWRFPFAFAQGMHNVIFDVDFPTNWGAPALATSTLYTTGATGYQTYPTQSGGTMDVSEFLTVQPYNVATNNSKEIAGYYPTKRTYHSPDNWIQPNVIETGDAFHKQLSLPYAPEDSRFVMQWDQAKLTTASTAPTDATVHFTADKFCYADAVVQQGTTKDIAAPSNSDSSTLDQMGFKPAPQTPNWVDVAPDGRLTLNPNYTVAPGSYQVPVLVGTETTEFRTVMVTITVIPAFFVEGYDDAYTGPGLKTVIFPQALRTVPEGTTFALDSSTIPDGWNVTIDSATGKITAIPTADAAPIRTDLGVTVTYTASDGTTRTDHVTAGMQVDRRVIAFEVNDSGHLIVTYNDNTTQDLGEVVGPQGQKGDTVRVTDSGTDADGNRLITFTPVDAAGNPVGDPQEITIAKGDKGDTGAAGQDGTSVTVANTTTDEAGNTVITFSDGKTVTVAKGTDATPLTVAKSEINADGDTVITFSDGKTATIQHGATGAAGQDGTSVSIDSTVRDDAAGSTTITFTDGSHITVLDGKNGTDGKDGASIEVSGTSTDVDGNIVVEFSDGSTVTIPKGANGQDGASIEITGTTTDDAGNTVITFSDGSQVVIPKGKDGTNGTDGKDGASLTVIGTTTDVNGNTLVTLSDGSVITIAKGDTGATGAAGQDGKDGKDAAPLTVTGSEIDADGNTVITFSDGSTTTVQRGAAGQDGNSITIESSTHDDASGTTTITFSDGSQITVLDGVLGQALTITGTSINPDTGETTVDFSDGTSMVIPAGQDGASIEITGTTTDDAGNTIVTFSDGSTIVLPKGTDGTNGTDGQDGASIQVTGTSVDTDGNTVITFSDGTSVTVAKGTDGTNGTSITVTGSSVNDRGETIVTFSDGSQITIPAPQSVRIIGTHTDETTGDITLTFSTGETITIPAGKAGKDGTNGTDGKDAAPLTITGQSVDPATGLLSITFSDGSTVSLPPAQAPKITNQQIVEREPGKMVVELTYDNGDVVDIPVPSQGTNGSNGASITILEQHTQADGSVELVFSDGSKVTVPAPAAPSIAKQEVNDLGEVVVTWTNGQTITIPRGQAGEQGLPGTDGHDGTNGTNGKDGQNGTNGTDGKDGKDVVVPADQNSSTGSSDNTKCRDAGLTVGLPLLALVPIGLLSTVDIPGTGPLFSQMNHQLASINTNIQKQLGIFNQGEANASAQFGGTAGQIGQIVGAVAGSALLITIGLLVANYLTQACSPAGEGFLPSSSTK